jgi:flagellar hook-length control protein FliK
MEAQTVTSPISSPDSTKQAPSPQGTQANSATPVVAANITANEPALPDDTAEPAPATKLAVPVASHPKDEKPSHPAGGDATPPAQPDVSALTELSSPVATQFLAAPASQAPQPAPAPTPGSSPNPSPELEDILGARLSAAAQTSPRSPSLDKAGNQKNTPASDAKGNSNGRATGTGNLRASPADPSPATATASDASDRPVRTTEPPVEHGTKSEGAPIGTNLLQAGPAPAPTPNHAAADLSAGAVSNAPPAASIDSTTPVRLSLATPAMADAPSFDALALKIAARSSDGENNFSIRLDPPELGRIEVNLNVNSDGHAQAALSADKPQTLELLQKDASALEHALKDAGLNLAGGMTFSLKGDGKSQAWRDMQNAPRGRNVQIAAVDAANANAAITTSAALAAQAYGLPAAQLDIRV